MQSRCALALFCLTVVGCDSRAPTASSRRAPLVVAPRVALFSTTPGARESELRFQPVGAALPVPAVARLSHTPDADVRGVVLPGQEIVLAIADAEGGPEASFGGWLFRLEKGRPARALTTGCFHASRPLVSSGGRVFVERGSPGAMPGASAGGLRVDSLEVDEVDPETGALRPVHTTSGYTTHLAASLDDEIILYRVAPGHADLVAVDVSTTNVRVLAPEIPAFARDFSLDATARALVYTNRDSAGWLVESMDLVTGARTTLARADGMWIAPHVWPGGGLLVNDRSGGSVLGGRGVNRPLGAGFDELDAVSADAKWAALAHTSPGQFAVPYSVELATNAVSVVAAPARARVSIAGFLP